MTNNNTAAIIALANVFEDWAGSLNALPAELRDTATVTDEYKQHDADTPWGDFHAALLAADRATPGVAQYVMEGRDYQPVIENGNTVAFRWTF